MTSSQGKSLNVRHLTNNQPFCGGVVLFHQNKLVLTLNTDGLPSILANGRAWRVGGVSGGQKPGETIWECALREAREELCVEVQLLSSPATYFYDIDTGQIYAASYSDAIAPLVLERQSNLFPYTPYRPGLPTGPYTYFGLFLAAQTSTNMQIQPGNDVEGLLLISIDQWPLLQQRPTLETMLQHGAEVIENTPLPRTRQLWVRPNGSLATVVTVLMKHPELVQH